MPLQLVSKEWAELVHVFANQNPEISSYCFKYFPEELKPKNRCILRAFCLAITYQAISTTIIWHKCQSQYESKSRNSLVLN